MKKQKMVDSVDAGKLCAFYLREEVVALEGSPLGTTSPVTRAGKVHPTSDAARYMKTR